MAKKTTHRYAQLSRQLLQNALLDLLKEKRFQKITVTDIVNRAELSRPTFYAHFETKDDLLMSYVDDLLDDIYSIISENEPSASDSNPADLVPIDRQLFDAWLARKEVFVQIRSADIDYLIFKKIRDHHYYIFNQSPISNSMSQLNPTLKEYCLNYMAGSVAMFMLHWMDQGMPHDPDDLAGLLHALNMRDFQMITGKFNDRIQ